MILHCERGNKIFWKCLDACAHVQLHRLCLDRSLLPTRTWTFSPQPTRTKLYKEVNTDPSHHQQLDCICFLAHAPHCRSILLYAFGYFMSPTLRTPPLVILHWMRGDKLFGGRLGVTGLLISPSSLSNDYFNYNRSGDPVKTVTNALATRLMPMHLWLMECRRWSYHRSTRT